MSEPRGASELEALLAVALQPIEPPESLAGRFEKTLSAVNEAAASSLADWAGELSEGELQALRDPRNWIRPVIAVAAGGAATGALVVLELRRHRRSARGERALRSLRRLVD